MHMPNLFLGCQTNGKIELKSEHNASGDPMRFNHHVFRFSNGLMGSACLIGVSYSALPSPVVAADQESPKEIIAVQIRRQGFPCENPQSVGRDSEASKPDEAVWVLQCENATYRVRLIPDMAADVERIE